MILDDLGEPLKAKDFLQQEVADMRPKGKSGRFEAWDGLSAPLLAWKM